MNDAAAAVTRAVEQAERLRRRQSAGRWLVRVIPVVALVWLAIAVMVRWGSAPRLWFWIALASGGASIAGVLGWLNRRPATNDAVAARADADARLGGELRSAHWFAQSPASGEWAAFHLATAALSAQRVDWPRLYPRPAGARSWAAAAACAAAAFAVLLIPARQTAGAAGVATGRAAGQSGNVARLSLPEDLRKQLEDLLAKMEQGTMPADLARQKLADLQKLLSRLDKTADQSPGKIAGKPGDVRPRAEDDEKLIDRANKAASGATGMPDDVKWSLQDLASKLASATTREGAEKNPSASTAQPGKPSDKAETGQATATPAGLQMVRAAATEAEAGQMMSGGGPMGGDPTPGRGGNRGGRGNGAAPPEIAKALRKETVEASADTAGQNVIAEIHRKTEQGKATVAFSRAAGPAAFERSHTVAPPPVPDARRGLVQRFFTHIPKIP